VRAETIITLSTLFGEDKDVRARLLEALTAPHPLCRVAAAEGLSTAHAEAAEGWRAISQMARRDPLPEVRRAAVLAFVHCRQPRTALSVARAALKDSQWPVRHAAIKALASLDERAARRLLLDAASNEEPPVRGAALRALAERDAPDGIGLACRAIGEADATLLEDAYAALRIFKRAHRTEMVEASKTCAPRAATVVSFVLEHEG
jgi:HEAT repeat protein